MLLSPCPFWTFSKVLGVVYEYKTRVSAASDLEVVLHLLKVARNSDTVLLHLIVPAREKDYLNVQLCSSNEPYAVKDVP
jgi:hypothetical protein